MKRQIIGLIIAGSLVPTFTHALTIEEINAQIQSLFNQLTVLQVQLQTIRPSPNAAPATPTASVPVRACPDLYRALSRGSRGDDVRSLQQFLIGQGMLSPDLLTGYFGTVTESAVQKWQIQNNIIAYGDISLGGYGIVGPRTRAAISSRCAVTTPSTVYLCPSYQLPVCAPGQHVEYGTKDANGCDMAPRCVNDPGVVSVCPAYQPCPPGYTGKTSTTANGCLSLQCLPPSASPTPTFVPTPTPTLATPSISLTIPQKTDYVYVRNADFSITWQSTDAPAASKVFLLLVPVSASGQPIEGAAGKIITSGEPVNGSYTWRIPLPGYKSPFDYNNELVTGDYIVNGSYYKVRAILYIPNTSQCAEGCSPHTGTYVTSVDSPEFPITAGYSM